MFGINSSALRALVFLFSADFLPAGSFSHFFLCISLRLQTSATEDSGIGLHARRPSPTYFICTMRQCWLNCQCSPRLVFLQYVINICFFPPFSHFLSAFLPFSRGLQIGWIRLYACFKALGVLFIEEEKKIHYRLRKVFRTFFKPSLSPSSLELWYLKYRCALPCCSATYLSADLPVCVFIPALLSTNVPVLWHGRLCCRGIYNSGSSVKDGRHQVFIWWCSAAVS